MCTTKSHTIISKELDALKEGEKEEEGVGEREDLLLDANPYSLSYHATILQVLSSSITVASASMIELSVELR